ncbi:MAG: ABC transporter permease [Candidatus Sericytochromatia bacterium]
MSPKTHTLTRRGGWGYQTHVLAERYFDVFMADWTALFFLIGQPLAVAFFAGLVWQGQQRGESLYFVLVFSAIFFGCVNACREIVKEKAIYARERLVGLQIVPYVLSKLGVLAALGFGQTLLFYLGVRYFLTLDGNPVMLVLTLYTSLLAGTSLGLVVSALVASDVMALALVPVCLIPQLLFSELVMPERSLTGLVGMFKQVMIVEWSHQAVEQVVAATPAWGTWATGMGVLLLMILGLSALSTGLLALKEL